MHQFASDCITLRGVCGVQRRRRWTGRAVDFCRRGGDDSNIPGPLSRTTRINTTAAAYFRNIYDNVTSIAIGMKITIKYCFQKTVTVQYPEQHLTFAPRYRGIHEFEADKCIACDMCRQGLPGRLHLHRQDRPAQDRQEDRQGRPRRAAQLLRYAIDYSKCLFCALCTEPCPTDCIHMGKLHDLCSYTPRGRRRRVRRARQEGPAHADPAVDGTERRAHPVGEGRVRPRESGDLGAEDRGIFRTRSRRHVTFWRSDRRLLQSAHMTGPHWPDWSG